MDTGGVQMGFTPVELAEVMPSNIHPCQIYVTNWYANSTHGIEICCWVVNTKYVDLFNNFETILKYSTTCHASTTRSTYY